MYSLHLLGKVSLEGPSGPLRGRVVQRRQLALLALLATADETGRSRDRVMSLLWPERSTDSARSSLTDAVYRVRGALGEEALLRTGDSLRLNTRIVRTDCRIFESLLEEGDLEGAVAVYGGPFLEGIHLGSSHGFEEWRHLEAQRLGKRYEEALEELAGGADWAGEYSRAVGFWDLLVSHDRFNTRFVLGRMQALAKAGDPGNAIRDGEKHAELLSQELGAKAPAPLLDLLERLRTGDSLPSSRPFHTPEASPGRPPGGSGSVFAEPPEGPLPPRSPAAARRTPSGVPTHLTFPFERQGPAESPEVAVPFVGREKELVRLGAALRRALEGHGSVVFLTGEAGTGKTALAGEFCRRAVDANPDLVVAWGHGEAQTGSGDPYLPFREILALLTGDVEAPYAAGALSRDQAHRLWGLAPVALGLMAQAGPDLAGTFLNRSDLLSRASTFASLHPLEERVLGWLKEQQRRTGSPPQQPALFRQYARVLRGLARSRPQLLILDDLQWADSGSVGLLFQLARHLEGSRILILALYRPSELAAGVEGRRHPLDSAVGELVREFGDLKLQLGEEGDRDFLDALVDADPNALGPGFRAALFQHTRGHALFTVELLRALRAQGVLARDEAGRWQTRGDVPWDIFPARVEAMIAVRLGPLEEDQRRLLSVASVEGEVFTLEAVAAVLGLAPEDLLLRTGRDLVRLHGLLQPHAVRRCRRGQLSKYRFRHILFQRYLYGQLTAAERSLLHRRLAQVLEDLHGEETSGIALHLAHHYQEGLCPDRAAPHLITAGVQATLGGAHHEARSHFQNAAHLLSLLPSEAEEDRLRARCLVGLGHSRFYSADPLAPEAFSEAEELARRIGAVQEEFWALFGSYLLRGHYAGNYREGWRIAARCRALAAQEGSLPVLAHAHYAVGHNAMMRGDLGTARKEFEAVVALAEKGSLGQEIILGGSVDLGPIVEGLLGLIEWEMGFPDRAKTWIHRGTASARKAKCYWSRFWIASYDLTVAMREDDPLRARERLQEMQEVAEQYGVLAFCEPTLLIYGGWVEAHLGDPTEVLEGMQEGIRMWRARGWEAAVSHYQALMARVLSLSGRREEGLRCLEDGQRSAEEREEGWTVPEGLLIQGDLLIDSTPSRRREAEASFRRALEMAQDQGALSFELQARMRLARLLRGRDGAKEAQDQLRDVLGRFSEGFGTSPLRKAKALLEELERDRPAKA